MSVLLTFNQRSQNEPKSEAGEDKNKQTGKFGFGCKRREEHRANEQAASMLAEWKPTQSPDVGTGKRNWGRPSPLWSPLPVSPRPIWRGFGGATMRNAARPKSCQFLGYRFCFLFFVAYDHEVPCSIVSA